MSDPAPAPRLARPDELDAVGELTVRAYRDGGVLSGAEDAYAEVLADARGRAAVAQVYVLRAASGDLLATMTLAAAGEPYADVAVHGELEMRMLAVDPDAQGKGIATAMVAFAAQEAGRRGLDALAISVIDRNDGALRLYHRLGFVRRPDRDVEHPPDVRLLTLTRPVGPVPVTASRPYCDQCGEPTNGADHSGCARRSALEPPRYCAECRRRMIVQVTPTGWTARCSEHGVRSA